MDVGGEQWVADGFHVEVLLVIPGPGGDQHGMLTPSGLAAVIVPGQTRDCVGWRKAWHVVRPMGVLGYLGHMEVETDQT